MKKLLSGLCASALALSFAAASVAPVNAAPIYVPKSTAEPASDVQTVQFRYSDRDRWDNDDWWERRQERRALRRVQRRGNYAYYNGYRGYPYYRDGYHQYGDFWYPAAAFVAGALITGAIVNNNRGGGGSHEAWCYNRYRSYRDWDNTFQPYNGPRQQCYSPYS